MKFQKGDSVKFTSQAIAKNNLPDSVLYYVDNIVSENGHTLYMLGGWGDQFLLAEIGDIVKVTTDDISQRTLNVLVDMSQTLKAVHHSISELTEGHDYPEEMSLEDEIEDQLTSKADKKRQLQ